MNTEAQRIAIAEACGWTEISDWGAGGINGKHPNGSWTEVLPDYLNDLNAMYEAEDMLNNNHWETWHRIVAQWTDNPPHATAAQRAEAFLQTINLWTYDT